MTNEEKRKIYAALAAPFPEHCIQRTEGRITGRGYDTSGIGYQFIANRLNEVLGVGGWRAHRVVTVKEVTRSNGRQAFEAIADITRAEPFHLDAITHPSPVMGKDFCRRLELEWAARCKA